VFLLVPAHLGSPGQRAVKWLLLLFLGPSESTTQTVNQLVQPFLHSSWQCRRVCTGMSFPLMIANSHENICTPCNAWFLGSTRLSIPNSISIASAILHRSRQKVPILYNWRTFPQTAPSHGGTGSHLIHDSLRLSKPTTTQMASRSVQPFLGDRL